MSNDKDCLGRACFGEFLGTYILVFVGCGAVHTAMTTGAIAGSGQAGMVWGLAVTLAVFVTADLSGAHINPAITIALAVNGAFSWVRVVPYILAQVGGAALAATLLYLCFASSIQSFETGEGIVRGSPGSEVSASMYGEYFPNPAVGAHGFVSIADDPDRNLGESLKASHGNLSLTQAALMEILATLFLALCVFALTDPKNQSAPAAKLAPFFIGTTVAVMVAIFGPMTQACMNPARDFGPRIVAYFAGWDAIAFPGPRGASSTLIVYLVAPIVGATLGGLLYRAFSSCCSKDASADSAAS